MSAQPHYSMVIEWSDEDSVYIVSLPEWGKYALTHGATYDEAVRSGQEVLHAHHQCARRRRTVANSTRILTRFIASNWKGAPGMGRRHAILALLAILVIGAVSAAWTLARHEPPTEPLVTVAQVRDGLARHPQAWRGRTVRVRGLIVGANYGAASLLPGCPTGPGSCSLVLPAQATAHLLLVADSPTVTAGSGHGLIWQGQTLLDTRLISGPSVEVLVGGLVLRTQPTMASRLAAMLRRLPLLGALAPPEQPLIIPRAPEVYRMRIPVAPVPGCRHPFVGRLGVGPRTPLCDDAVLLGETR